MSRTGLALDQASGTFTVTPPDGPTGHLPAARTWTVTFPALRDADPTVTVDGAEAVAEIRRDGARLSVRVDGVPVTAPLTVHLGADPRPARNDVRARVFALLDRAQIEYELKSRVLEVATRDRPLALRAAEVMALELEPALASAVAEILLAQAG